MKNQLNSMTGCLALFILCILMMISCKNPFENIAPESLFGTVSVDCQVSIQVVEKQARKMVNTDSFSIEFRTAGGELYKTYDRYAEMDPLIALAPGSYYVVAYSPGSPEVAFDKPYYYGESNIFSIDYEESKSITVEATLANCQISVIYSPDVKDQFIDYSTLISSDDGSLMFSATESRHGFYTLLPITIESSLTYLKPDSSFSTKIVTGQIADPQAGYHYEVHVEARLDSGETGVDLLLNESITKEIISIGGISGGIEGPIGYGELIITEIMYNPSALNDTEGEWFEIYNASVDTIDIYQLVIKAGNEIKHTIMEHIVLEPGDYIVLARSTQATLEFDYIYGSSLSLLNSGQDLRLSNFGTDGTNGSVICYVDYGLPGFPDGNGSSISLDPLYLDVEEAKNGNRWCPAVSLFDTGDHGTPGSINDSCL